MAKKQQVSRSGNVVKVFYPSLKKGVELDVTKLTPEIQHLALCHGIGQKLGDAASGQSASEKYEMASKIVANLLAGNWELTATDSGIEVIAAVAKIKKIPVSEIEDVLSEMDDEKRAEKLKEWRSNAKVKAQIAQTRAEKAAAVAEDSDDDEIEIE